MATDTTELTFIRCPDCRSLVPAMSSRCRMCGATLAKDAQPGEASGTNQPTPSRVRQQTVSTSSSSELTQQLSALRSDDAPVEEPQKAIPQHIEEKEDLSDPLEDFLSDHSDDSDDENEETIVASGEAGEVQDEDSSEFDDFDDFDDLEEFDELDDLDDIDDFDDEEPVVQTASEPVVEEKKLEPLKVDTETIDQAKAKVEEESKPKARVVVEQGRGKFSKGLSFGGKPRFDAPGVKETNAPKLEAKAEVPPAAPKAEPKAKTEPKVEKKAEPKVEQKVEPKVELIEQPVVEAKILHEVISETVIKEEPVMQPKFKEEHSDVAEEKTKPAKLAAAPVNSSTATKDSVKKGEQLGRIFGWLVSYSDPMGRSIELREGRFFVTSEQLRATDLVLQDSTVSVPHAMFTISTDGGIVIQDLKSERGVFVRDPNQSTYRREYDSTPLSHGDWVRFGDLEFLVSVIAHVGAN